VVKARQIGDSCGIEDAERVKAGRVHPGRHGLAPQRVLLGPDDVVLR
jgi:hypothetical protein